MSDMKNADLFLARREFQKIFEIYKLEPHQAILINNAWHDAIEDAPDPARAAWILINRIKENMNKLGLKQ